MIFLWGLGCFAFGVVAPVLLGHLLAHFFPDGTFRWGQWRDQSES